jgi:hypothetical protein
LNSRELLSLERALEHMFSCYLSCTLLTLSFALLKTSLSLATALRELSFSLWASLGVSPVLFLLLLYLRGLLVIESLGEFKEKIMAKITVVQNVGDAAGEGVVSGGDSPPSAVSAELQNATNDRVRGAAENTAAPSAENPSAEVMERASQIVQQQPPSPQPPSQPQQQPPQLQQPQPQQPSQAQLPAQPLGEALPQRQQDPQREQRDVRSLAENASLAPTQKAPKLPVSATVGERLPTLSIDGLPLRVASTSPQQPTANRTPETGDGGDASKSVSAGGGVVAQEERRSPDADASRPYADYHHPIDSPVTRARFNYASIECGAKVLATNSEASVGVVFAQFGLALWVVKRCVFLCCCGVISVFVGMRVV